MWEAPMISECVIERKKNTGLGWNGKVLDCKKRSWLGTKE